MPQVSLGKHGSGDGSGSNGSGSDDSSDDGSGGDGSGKHGHTEPRTFPAVAMWIVLVGGVLLGLLFAGIISSFVGGSSDSDSSASGPGSRATSTPSAVASRQSEDAQRRHRSNSLEMAASPEAQDVRVLGCGTDAKGFASARVLITNSTSKRATYHVHIVFTTSDDGRIISDDVATVKRLPPGQTSPLKPMNSLYSTPGEQVDCSVGSVSRF